MYLIDTCVWIEFLRGHTTASVRALETLLEGGEAAVCEITFAEICFGAKNPEQLDKYRQYFERIPFLKLPALWHVQAAEMGNTLRRKGHRPFLADLMIAITALAHDATLLTTDKDFQIYQKLFGLKLGD